MRRAHGSKKSSRVYLWLVFPVIILATLARPAAAETFGPRVDHTSVVFDNKIWVIGGREGTTTYKNDIWSSPDGIRWTLETPAAAFSPRKSHTSVVFDNKMWVIGGSDSSGARKNDVWCSADGINWTSATLAASFSPRIDHSSVVFDDRIWVIAGHIGSSDVNDVWSSVDGVNWIQATASAAFSARCVHSSVAFDGQIWVIGGTGLTVHGSESRNDVWSSPDGITWTQATDAATFEKRSSQASVVFDGKLWVIAGVDFFFDSSRSLTTIDYLNDVWSSSDGITWTQTAVDPLFSARSTSCVTFGGRMWVLGGYLGGLYENDSWSSFDGVHWTEMVVSGADPFWTLYR